LQVQEYSRGGRLRDLAHEPGPLRDEGLEPDFQPADAACQPARHGQSLAARGEVEGDADPVGGFHPSAPASPPTFVAARCARPTSAATVVFFHSQYPASSPTSRPDTPGSLKLAVPTWIAVAPAARNSSTSERSEIPPIPISGVPGNALCTWY